jgi:hypothetical protein
MKACLWSFVAVVMLATVGYVGMTHPTYGVTHGFDVMRHTNHSDQGREQQTTVSWNGTWCLGRLHLSEPNGRILVGVGRDVLTASIHVGTSFIRMLMSTTVFTFTNEIINGFDSLWSIVWKQGGLASFLAGFVGMYVCRKCCLSSSASS